jgi:hypothetical protein
VTAVNPPAASTLAEPRPAVAAPDLDGRPRTREELAELAAQRRWVGQRLAWERYLRGKVVQG